MGKIFKFSTLLTVAVMVIGCASSNRASLGECQKGMYCFKGINFGVSRGSDYEKGIRDGCRTGEGTFTKDYSMSSSSKNYFDGWILGRSKCKQILPNEGTRQEEENSKKRAEYQIEQMKLEQSSTNSDSQEGIIDSLLNSNDNSDSQDLEY